MILNSNLSIEDAIVEACRAFYMTGSLVQHVVISFEDYSQLCNNLGSKVQYVEWCSQVNQATKYRGVEISAPHRSVYILPDADVINGSMDLFGTTPAAQQPSILADLKANSNFTHLTSLNPAETVQDLRDQIKALQDAVAEAHLCDTKEDNVHNL